MVETELFADAYRSHALATVRYPVLEIVTVRERARVHAARAPGGPAQQQMNQQRRLLPPPRPLTERLGVEFFRSIPRAPGVYRMFDEGGRLLYVGQSRDLHDRLGSYRRRRVWQPLTEDRLGLCIGWFKLILGVVAEPVSFGHCKPWT